MDQHGREPGATSTDLGPQQRPGEGGQRVGWFASGPPADAPVPEDIGSAHCGQITTARDLPGSPARLTVARSPATTLPRVGREPGTDGAVPAGPPRGAIYVHLLTLVSAFAFWAWWDRDLWFFGDEWDFVAQRGLWHLPANPASIWFPHNEHWSTLPILLWRALFNIFHLSSYWPYIVPLLVLQVGVMHLCWRLSLRAGVRVWVAVAAVGLLGFLGAGAEDLTWAFQVGFVGRSSSAYWPSSCSMATALGSRRRRLWYASVALVASLMCSTIGDAMLVAAAVLAGPGWPANKSYG